MLALSGALFFIPSTSINHNAAYLIISITIIACTINLILLKKGFYFFAANSIITILSILTVAGLLNKIALNPQTGFTSYIYLMFPAIVVAGLFCSRKWLLFTSALFSCGAIFFYLVVTSKQAFLQQDKAASALVISLFALGITTILTYLVVAIGEKAIVRAEILASKLKDLADNLEIKVEERTEELQSAMEELKVTNDQLTETRDALWGEMELAKKIQTTLLPVKPEIMGYEIAAYLDPADEVGGDYYDVINVEGRDWMVIGDVSGHGVPSGLIMMMVQTSIQVVLTQNPSALPSDLLTLVNTTISKNIQKLNEDKYMTITVLACHDEGKIFFSGLHQDIMVYRNQSKTVELIETEGMWIGIVENIEGMIKDNDFIINKGDTMLLFTDGITEAWKKGSTQDKRSFNIDMFGEKQLENILLENGTQSAEVVKQKVLKALIDYKCEDDVTLLVVKRI